MTAASGSPGSSCPASWVPSICPPRRRLRALVLLSLLLEPSSPAPLASLPVLLEGRCCEVLPPNGALPDLSMETAPPTFHSCLLTLLGSLHGLALISRYVMNGKI